MSLLHAIYLLSIGGAALFFFVGVVVARIRVSTLLNQSDSRIKMQAEEDRRLATEELELLRGELVESKKSLESQWEERSRMVEQAAQERAHLEQQLEKRQREAREIYHETQRLKETLRIAAEKELRFRESEEQWRGKEGVCEAAKRDAQRWKGEAERLGHRLALVEKDLQNRFMELTSKTKEMEQCHQQLTVLQADNQRLTALSTEHETEQAELRGLRMRIQNAENRGEKTDLLREENSHLREQNAQMQRDLPSAADSDRVRGQNTQLLLEIEGLGRRITELQAENEKLQEMEAHFLDFQQRAEGAEELRAQIRSLEARIFAGTGPIEHPALEVIGRQTSPVLQTLEAQLEAMVREGSVRTAVVADRFGLLVAGVGERGHQEGLAAVAGLVEQMASRTRDVLPMGSVQRVSLLDKNDVVLSCRLFVSHNEWLALSTLGVGEPPSEEVEQAVATMASGLGH